MNSNIAILSTVINKELYQKSSQLFPKNIQKYVIDGTQGMYGLDSIFYMMKKLKGKGIDWLVMADEDVLFVNTKCIFSIIEEMKLNDYLVCGVRDGGIIQNRHNSPYVINTFFSIINFKELELMWNKQEVLKNNYILENEFDDDLDKLKGNYEITKLHEPYYCFYFWLRRKGKKILFLDATTPFIEDRLTTAVIDTSGEVFIYHTWYARAYGISKTHTDRINKIFELLKFENKIVRKPIVFKHKTFFIIKSSRKFYKRIIMRIQIIRNQQLK
ncbi:hypothetical protein ACFX5E_15680 [Flavobacterium sp. LS2P90]|uniref:Nucleotide-diphospho-sugar transferase domain-containing protein n=1 Tax=Flavobacterium xylosi TaxID=3230415 RepID=A0ABW6I138_9FLAO